MKRVLVTGATGFIGRHTLKPLLKSGYSVHAITSKGMSNDMPVYKKITWHLIDLFNQHDIDGLLKNIQPTHLLHLAWDTTPGKFWNGSSNLFWLRTSLELIESFKKYGGQRIVLAGSCAEYDWDFGLCKEGKTPCLPNTLYGHSKNSLRNLACSFGLQHNISVAQGAVFFLFGPHEQPVRFVPQIINGILNEEETSCTEGLQLRDFLYVIDAGAAFVALLNSKVEGLVNIASGKPYSLRQIVKIITEYTGKADLIKFGEKPLSLTEPPFLLASTTRLNKEVRWYPKYSLRNALVETVNWWRSNL